MAGLAFLFVVYFLFQEAFYGSVLPHGIDISEQSHVGYLCMLLCGLLEQHVNKDKEKKGKGVFTLALSKSSQGMRWSNPIFCQM